MSYKTTTRLGIQMAEGWHMSAFVEMNGNLFMDELALAPNTFGASHVNYLAATQKLADSQGHKFYGYAPCSHKEGEYTEFGLDKPEIVSPYAAALLITTGDKQAEQNLIDLLSTFPKNGTPMPDAIGSKDGKIQNYKTSTWDISLLFLAVNSDIIRDMVRKTKWYFSAKETIRTFDKVNKGLIEPVKPI